MRLLIALVLILLVVPVATVRADTDPSDKEPVAAIVQTLVEDAASAPEQPEIVIREVEVPSQAFGDAEPEAKQDMPQRGSFWWMVGVIVVAGVILYVLLD